MAFPAADPLVMTIISNSLFGYYSTVVDLEVVGWGFIIGIPPVTVLLVLLFNLRKGKTKKMILELFDHMLKFEVQFNGPLQFFAPRTLKNKLKEQRKASD
jgi:hypothetical protein